MISCHHNWFCNVAKQWFVVGYLFSVYWGKSGILRRLFLYSFPVRSVAKNERERGEDINPDSEWLARERGGNFRRAQRNIDRRRLLPRENDARGKYGPKRFSPGRKSVGWWRNFFSPLSLSLSVSLGAQEIVAWLQPPAGIKNRVKLSQVEMRRLSRHHAISYFPLLKVLSPFFLVVRAYLAFIKRSQTGKCITWCESQLALTLFVLST